jgi:hypothetical protein
MNGSQQDLGVEDNSFSETSQVFHSKGSAQLCNDNPDVDHILVINQQQSVLRNCAMTPMSNTS